MALIRLEYVVVEISFFPEIFEIFFVQSDFVRSSILHFMFHNTWLHSTFQRLYAIAALRHLVLGYPPNQLRLAQLSEVNFMLCVSFMYTDICAGV